MSELIEELRHHERDYSSLIHGPLCGRAADEIEALVKALEEILSAEKEFREGLPQDWDGDPLHDACVAAEVILLSLNSRPVGGQRT